MTDVSNPNDKSTNMRRRTRAFRMSSATLVLAALAGFVSAGPLSAPTTAEAAIVTSSAITVKWTGDTSSASGFQPSRESTSPHFGQFKNIAITVSQTSGIIDQAIRVSVAGFTGTKSSTASGVTATNAKNYLQAMQCWGTDPSAANFNQTCQWGGRAFTESNGLGDSVISDNAARVGPLDTDTANPTTHDVPFLTAGGKSISGKPHVVNGVTKYDILDYFSPSTTNEVTSARVGTDGTGYFDFETQTSDQAPQLGCGTAAHLRCWLVVVPRGSIAGGGEACSGIRDPGNDFEIYTPGQVNAIQGGSPVNDQCDYWNNRIVIPLDFTPTGNTCPVGGSEVRVIGSQLMVSAMSSWQPSLCQTVKSTFSFSTNPDSIARAQVIETGGGSPNIEYSSYPVSSGELLTDFERATLAKTKLSYAPVAISAVVIGFIAEFDGGRQESLNLSPRIMAKLLTQSYKFTVPSNSSDPTRNFAHLGPANRQYAYLNQDPEFQALNPTNWNQFTANPAIVLPGPSGADAIKQVWRWILADSDAVAFLNGTGDGYAAANCASADTEVCKKGMTVNPYYLPAGATGAHVPWYLDSSKNFIETPTDRQVGLTNLDGSPQKLSETVLDTFPKDDESLVPLKIIPVSQGGAGEKSRFDSIQYSPYTDNLLSGARQAFRANPNSKTVWDGTKLNAAGEAGDWVSSGTQLPGSKFMLAITDSPSAARYGLSTAGILVPNTKTVENADAASMAAALTALQVTSLDTVKQVNPAAVTAGGYPMTIVTYAGVNMTKATADARKVIAAMLKQITTTGQTSGTAVGQLPAGYLPLTADLQAQASTAATAIESYVPPKVTTTTTTGSNGIAQDSFTASSTDIETLAAAADPTVTAGAQSAETGRTEITATDVVARNGIALSLGIGLAGLLVAPILFRGRGIR